MDLPLSRDQAAPGSRPTSAIDTQALADTPFNLDMACAIACQESGIYLVRFINAMSVADALGFCVFDASGRIYSSRRTCEDGALVYYDKAP